MSKFGETADRILEKLSKDGRVSVYELERRVSLRDTFILGFMLECGLIEVRNGEVRITEFGSDLLNVERLHALSLRIPYPYL